jgi:hypothetical protein
MIELAETIKQYKAIKTERGSISPSAWMMKSTALES